MEKGIVICGRKHKYVWGDEFDENSICYAPLSQEVSAPDKWKITGGGGILTVQGDKTTLLCSDFKWN